DARRVADAPQRTDDVGRPAPAEGNQRRAAGLRLGERDAEILAAREDHGARTGDSVHIVLALEIAGECDVGRRELLEPGGLLSVAYNDKLQVRHGAEGLDDEIGPFIGRE